MSGHKLGTGEVRRIRALRRSGSTYQAISEQLGRAMSTIAKYCWDVIPPVRRLKSGRRPKLGRRELIEIRTLRQQGRSWKIIQAEYAVARKAVRRAAEREGITLPRIWASRSFFSRQAQARKQEWQVRAEWMVARSLAGETLEAIGKSLPKPISRERVRQILQQQGLTAKSKQPTASLTAKEAAAFLGICCRSLYRLTGLGKIKSLNHGGRVNQRWYDPAELQRFQEERSRCRACRQPFQRTHPSQRLCRKCAWSRREDEHRRRARGEGLVKWAKGFEPGNVQIEGWVDYRLGSTTLGLSTTFFFWLVRAGLVPTEGPRGRRLYSLNHILALKERREAWLAAETAKNPKTKK